MGYRAEPEALRAAGRKAVLAGEQAEQVRLGDPALDIAEAMPGGKSEDAAKRVAQSWQRTLKTWGGDARDHGEALAGAADEYERGDRENARGIDAAGR
ncbi:hypothetical protein [Saccharopolyspora flava]|uniref:Excreted virulence factor EspC, type VII ESX diderm n=1 Tax=Saccharopolyspora flava TaxID=95161 RepID=A0A1I6QNM9_9PSEU|nr:hypothetical protein [Saccharopolyspora flava]SFS54030.1 hypothetical protein SAMN05660874_01643 [Saccharopolyspora flava]